MITFTIYLKGATSVAHGPKRTMVGASCQNYDFTWSDKSKRFEYGTVELEPGCGEKLARLKGDFDDMVVALKTASAFCSFEPSFAIEGADAPSSRILVAPPVEIFCKERSLSIHGMIAEGLIGNGPGGEIQIADVETFLSPQQN